jgi:hypothetical protein
MILHMAGLGVFIADNILTFRVHCQLPELTNYTELSPFREAASCKATQDFPSILWSLKFYYLVNKSLTASVV